MNLAGELLAAGAEREARQIDEKLFFETCAVPAAAKIPAQPRPDEDDDTALVALQRGTWPRTGLPGKLKNVSFNLKSRFDKRYL